MKKIFLTISMLLLMAFSARVEAQSIPASTMAGKEIASQIGMSFTSFKEACDDGNVYADISGKMVTKIVVGAQYIIPSSIIVSNDGVIIHEADIMPEVTLLLQLEEPYH